jgi:ribosomal protein S18 acetylase RimI-like enzyme
MPELAPYVDDATSWSARRALYSDVLAQPGTVLLLAEESREVVGYGLAHVMAAEGTWLADTWQTMPVVGEIESLAVRPSHRGRGIGTMLFTALDRELAAAGVTDLILGALPGNEDALRLYGRLGFRPTWLYLRRPPPASG